MKIGTITYWWTQDNYGQVLQCFALIKFLRMQGHEAFLIKYRPEVRTKLSLGRLLSAFWRYVQSPSLIRGVLMWRRLGRIAAEEARKHPRHFDLFRSTYIPSTAQEYDTSALMSSPPEAGAYVCGSDQIWGSPHPVYFLQFAPKGAKRIAYAPSLGGIVPCGKKREMMSEYLRSFDLVSSREESGLQVLREMGFADAVCLPDPTLLLPVGVYGGMAQYTYCDTEPYMLIYLLGNETDVSVSTLYDYAKSAGLSVRYVASQGREDEYPKCYPSVEEWLGLIERAAIVVTNSFHGTVFCLQFNTPFMVLPVKGVIARMNNRIVDLLGRYGLGERIYSGNLEILQKEVDFDTFNAIRSRDAKKVSKLFAALLQSDEGKK